MGVSSTMSLVQVPEGSGVLAWEYCSSGEGPMLKRGMKFFDLI